MWGWWTSARVQVCSTASTGVQHREHSQSTADVARVVGELPERSVRSLEEQAVDRPLVAAADLAQPGGQGEDQMEVAGGKQFAASGRQPLLGGGAATGGAVPVAARVGDQMALPAVGAQVQVPAASRRAAAQDVGQRPGMAGKQAPREAHQIARREAAEDVRQHGLQVRQQFVD